MPASNSSQKTLKAGILGAGNISTAHVDALRQLPNVEIAAICDLSRERATALRQAAGSGEIYTDLNEMLGKSRPDVVHILLQPVLHLEAAKTCLASGSHVFVEKPFTPTAAQSRELQQAAIACGRQAGVNHNLTFLPGMLEAIRQIHSGRFGAVEHVESFYNLAMPGIARGPHAHWMFASPTNVVFELAVHQLSEIYRLIGKVRSAQTAVGNPLTLTNGQRFFQSWQSSLICERGTGHITLTLGPPYPSHIIHIHCEDGEIFIDARRYTVRYSENTKYMRLDNLIDGWRNSRSLLAQSYANFKRAALGGIGLSPVYSWQQSSIDKSVAAFYNAIATGSEPPVSAEEGASVIEMAEAVAQSGMRHAGELYG